jgi:aminoglycoside 3-N-acetyltransferase I
MDITIEKLDSTSVKVLTDLNALFADAFEDEDNYAKSLPTKAYIEKWLANDDHIALVALLNDEVIGGLVAYTLHKFEQQRSEVYIYDLAVATAHQRKGIGKLLINKLRDVAKQQGSSVIFVQADENDDAVHFYESLQPIETIRTRNFDFSVDQ